MERCIVERYGPREADRKRARSGLYTKLPESANRFEPKLIIEKKKRNRRIDSPESQRSEVGSASK